MIKSLKITIFAYKTPASLARIFAAFTAYIMF